MLKIEFDPQKVLKKALATGGDFAEIFVEDTSATSIVCEEEKIEKVSHTRDRGCGIRVIADLKTYYAYANDICEEALIEAATTVAKGVAKGSQKGPIALTRETSPGFKIAKDPAGFTLSDKAGLVVRAEKRARSIDKRIRQVKVVYGDGVRSFVVFNSDGVFVEEDRVGLLFLCQAIAAEGDVIQTGYEPLGGIFGLEALDGTVPEEIAAIAAKRALMMLGARRAPGGRMPVVLSSEAGGTMIHEAVGHGLEGDLAGQKMSVYSGKMGTQVASSIITVMDDPTIANKRGSFFFDDEGTRAKGTVLIKDGVLVSYMHDRLSAMKSGYAPTGNGRRESYRSRPIPRMTNTIIAPGKADPATIVRSVDKGLFVKKMGGGQVNTVNGDFVFEVTEGYMINNGEIGELVRGATLTGNGPEVLMTIDMVGTDLGFGIGTCGKDGQGVPVSDAQPTLRIPEITVGGGVS